MILTVTLNFAVDLTYTVDALHRGETMRVRQVGRQAGGKGVNVARVLHALGRRTAVCGFAGGFTGAAARAELRQAGLRDETVDIAADSRLTLMAVEPDGCATGFSEPGPEIAGAEWAALRERCDALLEETDVLVLSGSVPPSLPHDCYAELVWTARRRRVPVLLDADGPHLLEGVAAGPEVVKINAAELRGAVGQVDLLTGARELHERGARTVLVSDGPEGLVCLHQDQVLRAKPPQRLSGNPTGAGDAAAAALACGMADGASWPQRVREAVALSAAAVCAPRAGAFDPEVYAGLREQVEVDA